MSGTVAIVSPVAGFSTAIPAISGVAPFAAPFCSLMHLLLDSGHLALPCSFDP